MRPALTAPIDRVGRAGDSYTRHSVILSVVLEPALSLWQGEAKYQTGEVRFARQMTLATFFAGQPGTNPNTARLACGVLGGAPQVMVTAGSRLVGKRGGTRRLPPNMVAQKAHWQLRELVCCAEALSKTTTAFPVP